MSYSGLTDAEVLESRQQYGSNKLPEKKLRSWVSFFMETFQDKINIILLGMMVVFTIMAIFNQGTFAEPFGVALVLVIIAILNTSTGLRSQKSTKELKDKTSVRYCNVIRNGNTKRINTDELVVGDIVLLESGEAIYADGYLISGTIKVDNSVLNGESEDCRKNAWCGENPPYDAATRVPEGKDYVDEYSLFAGAMITEGEGKMIVTNVGIGTDDYPGTVNGKTITSIDEIEETKTSLDIQLDELADQISKFGYIGALIIVIALLITNILSAGGIGNYVDQGWINVLKNVLTIAATALTIIVAAVPEGLPLIVSLITAQNAKTMIKHNVLAKNTNKIPEAGNIQLLCTDKTGTLTKGKLVPVSVVDGSGIEIEKDSELYSLFKLGTALNATATFDENGSVVGGNATERALMSLLTADEYKDIVANAPVTNKKPFNSAYKYSAVETSGENGVITYYKGAPERLLAKAKYYRTAEGKQELDADRVVEEIITPFTSRAMRVIATGYSEQALSDEIPDDLTIISLVAIRDDVREEVPAAVQKMHEAGVQVMMITGDVLETAKAIAQDAGLLDDPENDICMSAETFDSLSNEEATEKLPHIKVIARATPNTKLRVVNLAQNLKLCVGMTGDGTNDSPALKAADVGFSMGSGTDVCKEAGDIIITDDNFVSITDAVLLGRTFMHNVHKFLKFQLPINVGLVILSILYPILLKVEAVAAVQILVINIVMDSLNSLSFGGEPAKDEYMKEKPIAKGSKLLDSATLGQIAVSVVAFVGLFGVTLIPQVNSIFATEEQYATARFVMLIYMVTFNGFNIRTDGFNLFKGISKNKLFVEIAVLIFALTAVIAQFGGEIMGCSPMNAEQWITVIVIAFMIIPIDLIRKAILKVGGNHE